MSFNGSSDDEDEDPSFSPRTMAALMESTTDTDTMDENDYELEIDEDEDDSDGFGAIDLDPEDDAEEDDDDEAGGEEEGEAGARGGETGPAANRGGQLQIAFDPSSRQILIVDSATGTATRLTSQHLSGSNLTLRAIRRMMELRFGGGMADDDDDEEEEDEDEDAEEDGGYWGPTRRKAKQWYEPVTIPREAGVNLERSGEFGPPPKKYGAEQRKFKDYSPNMAQVFRLREYDHRRTPKSTIGDFVVPNSSGTEVSNFQSKVYSGQYSHDGSFFYSACQDFNVYIYDTRTAPRTGSKSITDNEPPSRGRRSGSFWQHRSSLKTIKVVKAREMNCRWTITDANLSRSNEWLAYSSITPRVHLVKTGEGAGWEADDHDQSTLDFAAGVRGSSSFGIWSIRFSNDGKEIVAGANDGQIFVYDIENRRTILRVNAHKDDVNAVAFADSASSNLILSGSDDKFVKVWDRRSLSGGRASGTLVGHTEGITFVAPKGDGRYCLSNGKDQGMKLWDLRMMVSDETFDRLKLDQVEYGIPGWDYRQAFYTKPRTLEHPNDCSVMTYRGHAVLRTLIRCHFSPIATTNQRYVYSGSSDGKIHIWSLDGRIVQTLDRRNTHPLLNKETGEYNDPSAIDLRRTDAPVKGAHSSAVRDVSWHPSEASLMSTAWEGRDGIEGSIAKHEWKGLGGGTETLEDQVEREVQESQG